MTRSDWSSIAILAYVALLVWLALSRGSQQAVLGALLVVLLIQVWLAIIAPRSPRP